METNSMDLKSHAYLVLEQEACWLWKVAPDARGIGNSGIKLRARFPTFDILKILKEKAALSSLIAVGAMACPAGYKREGGQGTQ